MDDRDGWRERERERERERGKSVLLVQFDDDDYTVKVHIGRFCCWLFELNGISIFVGYLMPNPFLYKQSSLVWIHSLIVKTFLFQTIQFSQTALVQTIQFSINIVFIHTLLNFKTVLFQTIQFNVSTVSMSKTVLFQAALFSRSRQFKYQNSSISNNLVQLKYAV